MLYHVVIQQKVVYYSKAGDDMKKLKKLREKKGISQSVIAKRIGITQQAYANYENGHREPDNSTLIKIAEYYHVSVDYLLSDKEGIEIPVLGKVAAGIPIEALENVIDCEEISLELAMEGDYFALSIKGDSMEPKISDGDIVIVKKQSDVNSGDIAIVIINGHEGTCKKLIKQGNGLILISTNPKYDPMIFSFKEIQELPVVVLGKVVELRSKFS